MLHAHIITIHKNSYGKRCTLIIFHLENFSLGEYSIGDDENEYILFYFIREKLAQRVETP